jgi:ferrochelatase
VIQSEPVRSGPRDASRKNGAALTRPEAILLLAHGGPATPAQVPGFVRELLGGRATHERVAALERRYAAIGGFSPLPALAQAIGEELARVAALPTYVGMRHGSPSIEEAIRHAAAGQVQRLAAVCLSPLLPRAAADRYCESVARALTSLGAEVSIRLVESWHAAPDYLAGEAQAARAALERFPAEQRGDVHLVFSAHASPIDDDDRYDQAVRESAARIAALLDLPAKRWSVAYQSAPPATQGWLSPPVRDAVVALAQQHVAGVVVVPIGFVVDSLEVLYDLDIALAETARHVGLRLERAPLLNRGSALVRALRAAVWGTPVHPEPFPEPREELV